MMMQRREAPPTGGRGREGGRESGVSFVSGFLGVCVCESVGVGVGVCVMCTWKINNRQDVKTFYF